MAVTYDKISFNVNQFNSKYFVIFDIDQFLEEIGKNQNPNKLYSDTVKSFLDGLIADDNFENFEIGEMCEDFENIVMADLRTYLQEYSPYPDSIPQSFAGKNKNDFLKEIDAHLEQKERSKVDNIIDRYKRGELPIREMVRISKHLNNTPSTQNEMRAKEIAGYAAALKRVNESRSFLWRAFHPVRYFAEKREAKNLENLVRENVALKHSFEEYLRDFRNTPECLGKIREQIDANINNPERLKNLKVTSVSTYAEIEENSINNNKDNEINNNKDNAIVNDSGESWLDTEQPSLGILETAMSRFHQNIQKYSNFFSSISNEIKSKIKSYAATHSDTYELTEEISNQLIDSAVNGLSVTASEICAEYDIMCNDQYTQEELGEKVHQSIYKMFNEMLDSFNGINIPLKDKLVMTQMAIDNVLNKYTPVGYDHRTLGNFGGNYMLRDNADFIKEMLGRSLAISKNGIPVKEEEIKEISDAVDGAREELGIRIKLNSLDFEEEPEVSVNDKIYDNSIDRSRGFDNII